MLAEIEIRNKNRSNTGTLTVNGKTFVLVPASEYRALIRGATTSDARLPPKPRPLPNGNYDAIAAMRAKIARSQRVRDRPAGLTLIFCRASAASSLLAIFMSEYGSSFFLASAPPKPKFNARGLITHPRIRDRRKAKLS